MSRNPEHRGMNSASRRAFIKTAAVGGVASIVGFSFPIRRSLAGAQSLFVNPLRIPKLEIGRSDNGFTVYDLVVQRGATAFNLPGSDSGIRTPTLGINGSYLGPTLRIRDGHNIRINVKNSIDEDTTLHWHGIHLPALQDGGPHQVIRPGDVWSPEFQVKQKAGTFWYHSHLVNQTSKQVWKGLTGMLVVQDEEADALALPHTYGVDDIPLILQDRRFDANGGMDYNPSMHDRMMGMIGDVPLTNGTVTPFFEATTRLVRLRLLNGSNASIYNIGFEDNRPFLQIATDGGLLEAPLETTRVRLGPAERAEILVDVSDGWNVILNSRPVEAAREGGEGMGRDMGGQGRGMNGMGGMMGGMMENVEPQSFDFLQIRPADALSGTKDVPSKLASIQWLDEESASKTRRFELVVTMGPAMMSGDGATHTINDKAMDMSRIDERVELGATEIWEIENKSVMMHTFHVHDIQFQLLDRQGEPPHAGERGWKDTVLVNPGETVRVIARFDDYADPDNPYMYHCHILEHEDMGMMGQFIVA